MSGYFTSVSATLAFALTLSNPSVRTSTISILVPAMVLRMPSTRSRALALSIVPTNIITVPPSGRALLICSPAITPAATLSVPM